MKNVTILVTLLLPAAVLLLATAPLLAQEEARYSFASLQGSKQIVAPPGGEGRGLIYLYNIDGNRITHVNLEVSQAPAGWDVRIEPPRHIIQATVGDQPVEVAENLHLDPTPLLSEETRDIPEGAACIPIPGRGYALARVVQVVARPPQGEKLGAKGEIRISAEASWLGQTGAAAIKQARDFDFSAEVGLQQSRSAEVVIGASSKADGKNTAGGARGGQEDLGTLLERWLPTILAMVIVVAGAVLIPNLAARKRAGR